MWFIGMSAVSVLSVQVFLPRPMKITGLIESYYGQWSSENVIRKRGKILKFCGIFKVWMVKRNSIQRRCGITPYDPQGREWQVIVSVRIYFWFLLKFSVPPPKKKKRKNKSMASITVILAPSLTGFRHLMVAFNHIFLGLYLCAHSGA